MTESDERISELEVFEGELYELPEQRQEGEVLTALEFHQSMAIRHTDEADRHLALGIEEYIAAGEHLIEIKERMDPEDKTGDFRRWVETDYRRSIHQARRYMRVARYKNELQGQSRGTAPPSLKAALRMLAEPKEKKELTSGQEDTETPEPTPDERVEETSEILVTLPSGEQVTPKEAKEIYEKEYQRLEQDKEKTKKDQEKAQKAQVAAKKAKAKAELQQEQQQEKVNKEFREAVKASFEEQLAEIHARYGIEETPSIFEVGEEAWQEALANTRNQREEQILNILKNFFPFVSKMRQYEPTEASRACLKWPSPERSEEAIQDIVTWLDRVREEMEAQTTPGVLRAVEVER